MFMNFIMNLVFHIMSSYKDELTEQFANQTTKGVSIMEIIKKYGLYIVGGMTIVVITLVLVNKAVNRYEELVSTETSYNTLVKEVKANEKTNAIKDSINDINLDSVNTTLEIVKTENINKNIINDIINKYDKPSEEITKSVNTEKVTTINTKTSEKTIKSNKKLVVSVLRELSNSIDPQIENLPNI